MIWTRKQFFYEELFVRVDTDNLIVPFEEELPDISVVSRLVPNDADHADGHLKKNQSHI